MAMVKKQFLYLSVLLGSPSMTQDHFLLKILFVGRTGVTDPNPKVKSIPNPLSQNQI